MILRVTKSIINLSINASDLHWYIKLNVLYHPVIAQLVERRTVDILIDILRSLVQIRFAGIILLLVEYLVCFLNIRNRLDIKNSYNKVDGFNFRNSNSVIVPSYINTLSPTVMEQMDPFCVEGAILVSQKLVSSIHNISGKMMTTELFFHFRE